MLTLRLTPALAHRLWIKLPPEAAPVERPYADWCIHTFMAARFRYLLVTNTLSLFSVVLHARGITGEDTLIRFVLAALRDYLRESGRTFFYERFIDAEAGSVALQPVGSRPILAAIDELKMQAKWFLEKSDFSPFETADRINQIPLAVLHGRTPADVFPELVGSGMPRAET